VWMGCVDGLCGWVCGLCGWVCGLCGWVCGLCGWVCGLCGWVVRIGVWVVWMGVGLFADVAAAAVQLATPGLVGFFVRTTGTATLASGGDAARTSTLIALITKALLEA